MNIKNYLNILQKSRIIETKHVEIHGINPKVLYEPAGKEIDLPRFCSVEMLKARQMNRIAIQQIKTPIARTYKNAAPEDLKRLTSQTIEDSYSRVEWTNPNDGKVYNLLKQGETEDGKIIVRILDSEGAFIKEAKIKPRTIAIPDDYNEPTNVFGIPHGDLVLAYAKRNNPFAKYIKIPISLNDINSEKEIEHISKYLQHENVDYLSCSYGISVYSKNKLSEALAKGLGNSKYDDLATQTGRIIFGSGNISTENYYEVSELSNRFLCLNTKVEGVGSLTSKFGKAANFSMSRNSALTQHYELGEFYPRLTKHGLNITNLPGTDFPFPNSKLEKYSLNPLLGKSVKRVQQLLKSIDERIKVLEKQKYSLFKDKKSIFEIIKERTNIEKQIHIYRQRKSKILSYAGELTNLNGEYNIIARVNSGTSFSTPIRTAKLALNDMMEDVI